MLINGTPGARGALQKNLLYYYRFWTIISVVLLSFVLCCLCLSLLYFYLCCTIISMTSLGKTSALTGMNTDNWLDSGFQKIPPLAIYPNSPKS